MVFMLFFGTYLFQVGLIGVLVREYRGIMYLMPVYGAVFLGYAGCKVGYMVGRGATQDQLWDYGLFVFFSIVQKIGACAPRGCISSTRTDPPVLAWTPAHRMHALTPRFALVRPPPFPHLAVALVYYLVILRTALRLGQLKWYQRQPWVQRYTAASAAGRAGSGSDAHASSRGGNVNPLAAPS
jgi:hypothetical protein